jgi:hypothetical protein
MLIPAPPLTNAQRQWMFQAAHPGYDRRRKARKRAGLKAHSAKTKAARAAAEALATASAQIPPAPLALPPPPVRLMLPAPVTDPAMSALNALAENRHQSSIAA